MIISKLKPMPEILMSILAYVILSVILKIIATILMEVFAIAAVTALVKIMFYMHTEKMIILRKIEMLVEETTMITIIIATSVILSI